MSAPAKPAMPTPTPASRITRERRMTSPSTLPALAPRGPANAELTIAVGDGVCGDAVNADDADTERDGRENREQRRDEPLPLQLRIEVRVHRAHLRQRYRGIDARERRAYRCHERQRNHLFARTTKDMRIRRASREARWRVSCWR